MYINTVFKESYKKMIQAQHRGKNASGKQEPKQNRSTSTKEEKSVPISCAPWQLVAIQHTTMSKFHVVINLTRTEHPQTPPTNMHRTLRASHMVTSSVLLDQDTALWALLDVLVLLSPTLQQPLPSLRIPMYLPFLTAEPLMVLPTGHANRHETRSALEDPTSRIGFEGIDFGAIRSGAVLELLGMATEVVEEGDFQQAFDLCGKKESLYDREGDRKIACPLVAYTRQRELFGIGGSEEEVAKATGTICVATTKTIWLVNIIVTDRTDFPVLELVLRLNGIRQRLANKPVQTMTRRFPSPNDNFARGR